MATPLPQAEIQRSLKVSLWDGFFSSLTVGLAEIYFAPFLLFTGAANLLFGLLNTAPQFLGSLSQLLTVKFARLLGSRKRLSLLGVLGQALSLGLLILTPFLGQGRFYYLFVALSLYWISWTLFQPAWQSWMGDLVPRETRGQYFGRRNRLMQLATFSALVAGGWILSRFQGMGSPFQGFLVLFSLGILSRLFSFLLIRVQADVPLPLKNSTWPSFLPQGVLKTPLGLFSLYSALFTVAIHMTAPYFVAYVLEDLHFTYLQFMILVAALVAGKYFSLPLWGRASDLRGNARFLSLSAFLLSGVPFLWILSPNFYFLAGVHFYAGVAMGGFELCSLHFLLGETKAEARTEQMAFFEILEGIAVVVGALLGGLLLSLDLFHGKTFLALLFISGVARTLLSLGFLPRLLLRRQVFTED